MRRGLVRRRRMVQRRCHRVRRKIRPSIQRMANGGAHVQAALRGRRRRSQRSPLCRRYAVSEIFSFVTFENVFIFERIISLNANVSSTGGHDGQSYLNSIERYDPQTNQWSSDVALTSTCRTSVGVAVLDGFMYAVGGQDGVSCLNVVERYDPQVIKSFQIWLCPSACLPICRTKKVKAVKRADM